ncbi:NUDIX domain-containing protein [Kitasatospora sp. NPDC058115]|uniref:NUDIX domain-containing protein n=1 Tax=Kitasatospora sp. NPDC058115 TaxID=3346347 RepID=UPI0036DCB8FB
MCQVPAGSIRPGEVPEAAALREAREETGQERQPMHRTTEPHHPTDQRHRCHPELQPGLPSPPWRWSSSSSSPPK